MENDKDFSSHIMRIINKLISLEKKSIFEYKGLRLFPSEIHLMTIIAQDKTTNATKMAKRLGVTKGAISQTLTRLERKGILYKTKDPYNKNELTAHFTSLGENAMKEHNSSRAALQTEHEHYIGTLTGDEKAVIRRFLAHVEHFVDRLN